MIVMVDQGALNPGIVQTHLRQGNAVSHPMVEAPKREAAFLLEMVKKMTSTVAALGERVETPLALKEIAPWVEGIEARMKRRMVAAPVLGMTEVLLMMKMMTTVVLQEAANRLKSVQCQMNSSHAIRPMQCVMCNDSLLF